MYYIHIWCSQDQGLGRHPPSPRCGADPACTSVVSRYGAVLVRTCDSAPRPRREWLPFCALPSTPSAQCPGQRSVVDADECVRFLTRGRIRAHAAPPDACRALTVDEPQRCIDVALSLCLAPARDAAQVCRHLCVHRAVAVEVEGSHVPALRLAAAVPCPPTPSSTPC